MEKMMLATSLATTTTEELTENIIKPTTVMEITTFRMTLLLIILL